MKQRVNQTQKTAKPNKPRANKAPYFRVRRSLFKKYLIFGIVILLTSFIALSVTMYIFVNRYWEEEKKVSLIDNAKRVADVIESSSTYLPAAHMLIIDRESPVGLTVVNMLMGNPINPINCGAIAMLGGFPVVFFVSLLTKKMDNTIVNKIFECYK